jgi:hypothetical protein
MKNNDGRSACGMFAEGRMGQLTDYCLNDVYLTRMLYNHIIKKGYIIAPNGGMLEMSFTSDRTLA